MPVYIGYLNEVCRPVDRNGKQDVAASVTKLNVNVDKRETDRHKDGYRSLLKHPSSYVGRGVNE